MSVSHHPPNRALRPSLASWSWLFLLALMPCPPSEGAAEAQQPEEIRRYTYSWPFTDDDAMRPRGGTTRGPELTLAAEPSDAWRRLTEAELTDFERDRRAILAMAGGYRTTFDFIETIGFTPDYQPRPPYQSWATEYVYVIADEPRLISLQHILVMTFQGDDGSLSEPMVTKHWRQDWRYEDHDLHVYAGRNRFERRRLPPDQVRGTWSQSVFQVDDSPRYQAVGRWHHNANHSTWTSNDTWRPLPRRESSVRDDYDVLAGTNRVTLVPQGWVHEEDNLKVVLNDNREPAEQMPFLAREAGLNRYRHVTGYDFSAGDVYWDRTAPFWAEVRDAWGRVFAEHDAFTLRPAAHGKPLFQVMFELAERFAEAPFDAEAARAQIDAALDDYVEPAVAAGPVESADAAEAP